MSERRNPISRLRRPAPVGWFGAAVALMAAISLAVAVVRVPAVVRFGYHRLDRAPSSLRQADVAPLGTTAPTAVFVAAAKAIPRDATFAVVGIGFDAIDALALWLAPRVLHSDYHQADWVIVFGNAPSDLSKPVRIRLAQDVYAFGAAQR